MLYIISKINPSIIALSESWLKPGSILKIKNYFCLNDNRIDNHGGVVLLIHSTLLFTALSFPPHGDGFSIVGAKILNISFVSIYIPHPSTSILNEIHEILQHIPKPFLILGDFNCHHQAWGSSISNAYGNQLINIFDNLNLCVLNDGTPTRRTKPEENLSAVDLSISTPDVALDFTWCIRPYTHGSDHYPIVISLANKNVPPPPHPFSPRMKYRLADADWHSYKSKLENIIPTLPQPNTYTEEICIESLLNAMSNIAEELFPKKNSALNRRPSPAWWDKECSEAVKKRKLAEKEYNLNMTSENYDILVRTIEETKEILVEKRKTGWKRYCTSISPHTPSTIVWQNIRKFKSTLSNPTFSLPQQLSSQYLDHLAPSYAPQKELVTDLNSNTLTSLTGLNSPFTFEELKSVLMNTKDSAPGEDGLPYSFYKHFGDSALFYLLDVINTIMLSGHIPKSWKAQIVLPILKPNKQPSDVSSYRPIALSNVVAKIAEHLVKNRLEWYVESNNLLAKSQYGFRRGKSCMDSISIFVTDIRVSLTLNKPTVGIFLDIKSAYDNVLLTVLKTKLEKLKVPLLLSNFIINLLSGRTIRLDSSDECRTLWKGLPQGSVLSPLLYSIYTYDLEFCLLDSVKVLQYADDLLFYCSDNSIEYLSTQLSLSLISLKSWLVRHGLELSVGKSTAVLFSRLRNPPFLNIKYDGKLIPQKEEAKFLGLVLDSKLSGIPHSELVSYKCEQRLNMLRCLAGVWWGAHPFSLKLAYNALIRSVLDYGSFLLEPCRVSVINKFNSIQNKSLRIIAGAMKSSPINALQVECAEPPLKIRRQFLADRFFCQAFQFCNHPLIHKLSQLIYLCSTSPYWVHKTVPCLVNSANRFTSLSAPTYRSTKLPLFDNVPYEALVLSPEIHVDLDIEKGDINSNNNFNSIIHDNWDGWHHIYCDASKHGANNTVGVGVFHREFNIIQKIKLPQETSVFTGECFAIYKALEYILLAKLPKTLIISDSKSALQSLERFPFKSKATMPVIVNIRDILYKCHQKSYSVTFLWVPSHSGIKGNEKADQIANDATGCGDMYPYVNYCHDIATLPKLYLQNDWRDIWEKSAILTGKHYYSIQSHLQIKPWFSKILLGKRATSSLIRLRVGHVCSPAHLHKFRIVDNPSCSCGEPVADVNHLLLECPLTDVTNFYESLIELEIPFPINVSSLLTYKTKAVYGALSKLIIDNDLKL